MASAKQIKARKAFVKKYAKKGKRSNPKTVTNCPMCNGIDVVQKRRARATGKAGALQARENLKNIRKKWDIEDQTKLAKRYAAKGRAIMKKRGKRN